MAFNARSVYEGDGSSNAWTVSFSYLKKSHVKLYIDDVEDATFTWITDSSVAATSTPADGAVVRVQRETPRNALDTTIPASGTFRGADINNQSTQALYVADEGFDSLVAVIQQNAAGSEWEGEGLPIANVADPVDDQDVATKAYTDEVAGVAAQAGAEAAAVAAEDWAITAEDTLVPVGSGGNGVDEYSSLHWSAKSEASATAAAASASTASGHATSASNAQTAAEAAQTAAELAETNAETVYDQFDDRYLGSKASDPALDNDGDALLTGALYYNTGASELRVYSGSVWQAYAPAAGTSITGTPAADQIAVWTSSSSIEGDAGLTYDGSALDVTGNIVVSGTVDGVDIAARDANLTTAESKLAGIEAGATADQTAGEIEAVVNHDNLVGFVANEHIDWTSTSSSLVTTGNVTANTITATTVAGDAAAGFNPGGRLTAASGERIPASLVSTGTVIYYTQVFHAFVPLYDGTSWEVHEFTELTNTFSDATKNPAATAANSNYDLFIWDDAGTVRLSRGPAWTNDTTRSAGTAIGSVNGRFVNNVNITNGPLAFRGLYVGTFRTNGSNQLEARLYSSGVACNFLFQNWYNQLPVTLVNDYSGSSHTYSSATTRRFAGDAATDFGIVNCVLPMRLQGQVEITSGFGGVGSGRGLFGMGNGVNTFSLTGSYGDSDGVTSISVHSGEMNIGMGFRTVRTLENAPTGLYTAYRGDSKGYIRWMI